VIQEGIPPQGEPRPLGRDEEKGDRQAVRLSRSQGPVPGTTTVACNFAVELAQESGRSTLLIDLDLPLGDAALCRWASTASEFFHASMRYAIRSV